MDSYPRVLIGTDGSPDATAAVRVGGRVAAGLGVGVEIITAWRGDRDADWAAGVLAEAEVAAKEAGAAEVSVRPVEGSAPEVLVDAANADPQALVVVGSTGLSKATSRLVASTSNKLTHHSLADVLFARDPVPDMWHFVALTTDGSETSHRAVRRGLVLAKALNAKAQLITAAKSEDAGQEVLQTTWDDLDLGNAEVGVERDVLVDPLPASAIALNGWKYEVIAIGNRGMSGPARLLGSVANKVTHEAKTNLLLVNTTRS